MTALPEQVRDAVRWLNEAGRSLVADQLALWAKEQISRSAINAGGVHPDGWRIEKKKHYTVVAHPKHGSYAASDQPNNIAACVLYHFAEAVAASAATPAATETTHSPTPRTDALLQELRDEVHAGVPMAAKQNLRLQSMIELARKLDRELAEKVRFIESLNETGHLDDFLASRSATEKLLQGK